MCQMLLLVTHMSFFQKIYVFFSLAEETYLRQIEPISTLKHLSCRKNTFQTLTQFSQGKNVLDAPAFYTDAFLLTGACLSSP
jgi:hypothetical protein